MLLLLPMRMRSRREAHYDAFVEHYNILLGSDNYVTRRQSLKLLGELLLDRSNFTTMMRYISSKDNLKMMMILLRNKSGNIQFEAFHVFKVFVANPRKPAEVSSRPARDRASDRARAGRTSDDDDKCRRMRSMADVRGGGGGGGGRDPHTRPRGGGGRARCSRLARVGAARSRGSVGAVISYGYIYIYI